MRMVVRWSGVVLLAFSTALGLRAQQLQYLSGQTVAPYFEGWEENPDGSFDMVFGYLNRNYREEVNIPLGASNKIDPAGLEQTQPTYFYPRRHRFMFRVRVPKDWGKKDVSWTVTSNGKTETAYGHLVPEQVIDNQVISQNRGGGGGADNKAPTVSFDGDLQRIVRAGEALTLTVKVSDDGLPRRRTAVPQLSASDQAGIGVDVDGTGRRITATGRFARRNASGLRVAWIQWRGPGKVSFDPWYMEGIDDHMPDFVPVPVAADGKVSTTAKFSAPGSYVVRAMADDGALFTAVDCTVTVTTPSPATP